jgi:hypothetical protein
MDVSGQAKPLQAKTNSYNFMNMRNAILLLLFFLGANCTNRPSKIFIGKWQIINVVENGQFIKLNDNWMDLKSDGTFSSYDGNSNKKENGKWVYSEKEKVLSIDDASGNNDDSEWILLIKADTLIFTAKKGNLYLIAKRIK